MQIIQTLSLQKVPLIYKEKEIKNDNCGSTRGYLGVENKHSGVWKKEPIK